MFEKFSRSWSLIQASASVLRSDKELLVFPALSGLCSLIVIASFFVPIYSSGLFEHLGSRDARPTVTLVTFAFYFVQYFVIVFFNSALVGAATIRLRGGDPSVGDGLRIAASKLPTILGYAAIAATVGMVLRAIQERSGLIGKWIAGLLGAAWTVATFLAVPVLVNRDVGPIDAVKGSVALLKQTWGENLIGNGGIGTVFGLITLLVMMLGIALVVAVSGSKSPVLIGIVVASTVLAVLSLSLVQAALQGIYSAALYRYAEEGQVGEGFDHNAMANAFRVKA
jgi:hypothetical protein